MNEYLRLAMKLSKRFALSTLLLLMLVVAVVFGYAQWRRQWLLSEVKKLNSIGVVVSLNEDVSPLTITTTNGLWAIVKQPQVGLRVYIDAQGKFDFGKGEMMSLEEMKASLEEVIFQSRRMGVGVIALFVQDRSSRVVFGPGRLGVLQKVQRELNMSKK
jgi:hypothetical protein